MKSKAVVTLPLSPKKSNEYARLVTPVLGETLSKAMNASFYLCVNLLDSFGERTEFFEEYQSNIAKHKIECQIWKDNDYLNELLENISRLIKNGYIYEKETEVYVCSCTRVEIERKNIDTCNPNNRIFQVIGNELYCPKCNGFCHLERGKSLIFDPSGLKNSSLLFRPNYLNNKARPFLSTISNSYTVISRKRNTGVSLNYNGKNYNIDIDFLWATYLSLFNEEEKILICGNKELYQLFLAGIIERCINPFANTILIGTPIITNINDYNYAEDVLTRKLSIIFNTRWGNDLCKFNEGILTYLDKLSMDKKIELYNMVCEGNDDEEFIPLLDDTMKTRFDFQSYVRRVKKGS